MHELPALVPVHVTEHALAHEVAPPRPGHRAEMNVRKMGEGEDAHSPNLQWLPNAMTIEHRERFRHLRRPFRDARVTGVRSLSPTKIGWHSRSQPTYRRKQSIRIERHHQNSPADLAPA